MHTPTADHVRILVVMGVSGSGKSTVAGILAERLGWDRQEGDDLHPAANIAKMAQGLPLDDEDRRPWLDDIAAWIRGHVAAGTSGVITCSALRRSYRDRLRGPGVVFVYLAGSVDQIGARLAERSAHFMPPALLASQLDTLEPPEPDEMAIVVNIGPPPAAVAAQVLDRLALTPQLT
jgi:gluconokinase